MMRLKRCGNCKEWMGCFEETCAKCNHANGKLKNGDVVFVEEQHRTYQAIIKDANKSCSVFRLEKL